MKLQVYEKKVYGRSLWYPLTDEGIAIAKLIGKLPSGLVAKTISPRLAPQLKEAGFEIEIVKSS